MSYLLTDQENLEGEMATIQLAAHASDFVLADSFPDVHRLLLT